MDCSLHHINALILEKLTGNLISKKNGGHQKQFLRRLAIPSDNISGVFLPLPSAEVFVLARELADKLTEVSWVLSLSPFTKVTQKRSAFSLVS